MPPFDTSVFLKVYAEELRIHRFTNGTAVRLKKYLESQEQTPEIQSALLELEVYSKSRGFVI